MNKLVYIILFFVGCTPAGRSTQKQNKAGAEPAPIQSMVYSVSSNQTLDAYFPARNKNNNKTIIYVHGGAWYAGDKTEAPHWPTYFQSIGYTFIAVNYRLTHTQENNVHPAQMADIDSAINFILGKSTEWKINPNEFIIMGASAGGHLALLYAYKYNSARKIKLAISLCGITDLTDYALLKADLGNMSGDDMVSWFIGDTLSRDLAKRRSASPLFSISSTAVPSFFVHGKNDEIVPYQQSVKAYQLLKKFKIPAGISLLDGVDHDLLSIDMTKEFNKIDLFIKQNIRHK